MTTSLNEIIADCTSQLSYSWFKKKEIEFLAHKHYDHENHKLVFNKVSTCVNYEYDATGEISNGNDLETFVTHSFSISDYCASYLPIDEINGWGVFDIDHFNSSKNIRDFAKQLVNETKGFVQESTDNVTVFRFINAVLALVEDDLSLLKKKFQDDADYISILDRFYKQCIAEFHIVFGKELILYNALAENEDKLHFNLTQEQLMGLIYILQRADCFTYTDNIFIQKFCLNHFMYKGRNKMLAPSSLSNISKELSSISSSQTPASERHHPGLHKVGDSLKAVIDKLL